MMEDMMLEDIVMVMTAITGRVGGAGAETIGDRGTSAQPKKAYGR